MFHRHLPRLRKIGINTTGLTPHRAIPMLTRIVEFCAEKGMLISIRVSLDGIGDIHDQVRAVKNGFDKATQDHRGDAGAGEARTTTSRSASPRRSSRPTCADAREHPRLGPHEGARRRLQHAALHRRDAPQQGARGEDRLPAREEEFMRKFFLDRVQEESVLSGQAFMYLHYADMIANGYQRTMPCPFQSQGLLLNPERRPALLRELARSSATCSTTRPRRCTSRPRTWCTGSI